LVIDSLFIGRVLILVFGLISFYKILTFDHLGKRTAAWFLFQTSIVLLWLTSAYRTQGQLNPLPQTIALMVTVISLAVGLILLVFALGVDRREGRS
jgi:multisubunit Na+/H+ antiporter MnhC subunit